MKLFDLFKKNISNEDSGINIEFSLKFVKIILLISICFNFMTLKFFQETVLELFKVLELILILILDFLKHISSEYSGFLGFTGSVLGGCIAILVYKLQVKNQSSKEIKRLMFLTLDTYKSIKLLDLNGDLRMLRVLDSTRVVKFKEKHSAIVYDKEWSKLISNISEFEDARALRRWFYCIEQMLIKEPDALQEMYVSIESILRSYGYSKELEKIKNEFYQESQK
ncbi:hypothetical protein [Paraclostridium sordellii]|uniref:hypothetical protein n=1 Tax=Paraclostridium sordellii TaxID=1505 RepID=UPI000C782B1A|nr:hypothetical protein [Paeniclostridium sordellii]AUN12779.1 hypothetical protein RSJ16_00110 [Paeniclostridium sordellii]